MEQSLEQVAHEQAHTFKEKFMYWISHITPTQVMQMALSFGIGFIAGMMFKKNFNYIVVSVIFFVCMLLALLYFDLAVVHMAKIKALLGMQAVNSFTELQDFLACLVCVYNKQLLSGFLGFLIGLKVG